MAEKVRIEFMPEKETKGTVRYHEIDNSAGVDVAIGALYIRKTALAAVGIRQNQNLVIMIEALEVPSE